MEIKDLVGRHTLSGIDISRNKKKPPFLVIKLECGIFRIEEESGHLVVLGYANYDWAIHITPCEVDIVYNDSKNLEELTVLPMGETGNLKYIAFALVRKDFNGQYWDRFGDYIGPMLAWVNKDNFPEDVYIKEIIYTGSAISELVSHLMKIDGFYDVCITDKDGNYKPIEKIKIVQYQGTKKVVLE